MPQKFGQSFSAKKLELSSGGAFEFDAVSADGRVVANISTSAARTASGRAGVGKFMKIRSDMYFLLLVDVDRLDVDRRIIVLTQEDMYHRCLDEVSRGRVDSSIEFVHAEISAELQDKLRKSRGVASHEVSPPRASDG